MDSSFFRLPRRYDSFLFAPVCKEFNGAPLTVLSVLARMDLDPWDEAARLGAMQRANAKSALASMLNRIPGGYWSGAEVDGIAAQLVRLLPDGSTTHDQPATANAWTRYAKYGLVLLIVALAISFLVKHGQSVDVTAPASGSAQTSPNGDGAGSAVAPESPPLAPGTLVGPETRALTR